MFVMENPCIYWKINPAGFIELIRCLATQINVRRDGKGHDILIATPLHRYTIVTPLHRYTIVIPYSNSITQILLFLLHVINNKITLKIKTIQTAKFEFVVNNCMI